MRCTFLLFIIGIGNDSILTRPSMNTAAKAIIKRVSMFSKRLDFDKAIDEYSCKGNHQKSEHVFKTFYSKMGFLHVESGGLQRPECGLESPTLAIERLRIVALQ